LLFIANSAIFQLYHGENKLIINEMMSIICFKDTSCIIMKYNLPVACVVVTAEIETII
jgi:hypothetical protein